MASKLTMLIASAKRLSEGNHVLFNTVVKESLHRDILSCLSSTGVAKHITFQGGTALRLCHGNNRYSEGLDFVTPDPLPSELFDAFKDQLSNTVRKGYGVDVIFKDPKENTGPANASGIDVKRWSVKIALDELALPYKKSQVIHVEVAEGIPALDASPMNVMPVTGQGAITSTPFLLQVSSTKEILADKLVALIGRPYIKGRDLWDMKFLKDRNTSVELDWIIQKCGHYGISTDKNEIVQKFNAKASELADPNVAKRFKQEMSRFLSKDMATQWLKESLGTERILMDVGEFVEGISEQVANLSVEKAKESNIDIIQDKIKQWRDKHNTMPSHTDGSGMDR